MFPAPEDTKVLILSVLGAVLPLLSVPFTNVIVHDVSFAEMEKALSKKISTNRGG